MLSFEFDGALLQSEQRDPELPPLFQLPPRSEALSSPSTLALRGLDPGPDHGTHLRQQRQRYLVLMGCEYADP